MKARIAPLIANLLFLFIGSALVWFSLRLPNGIGLSAAEPGPGLFPLIVGSFMCLSAAAHLFLSWRLEHHASTGEAGSVISIIQLVIALAAYIFLLPRIGFVLASLLLTLCTLSIYGMPGYWRRIGSALVITGISYLVFTQGLGVNMPTAAWFH
jgi:Tripartite tricarboxylate transporter TctB family